MFEIKESLITKLIFAGKIRPNVALHFWMRIEIQLPHLIHVPDNLEYQMQSLGGHLCLERSILPICTR